MVNGPYLATYVCSLGTYKFFLPDKGQQGYLVTSHCSGWRCRLVDPTKLKKGMNALRLVSFIVPTTYPVVQSAYIDN